MSEKSNTGFAAVDDSYEGSNYRKATVAFFRASDRVEGAMGGKCLATHDEPEHGVLLPKGYPIGCKPLNDEDPDRFALFIGDEHVGNLMRKKASTGTGLLLGSTIRELDTELAKFPVGARVVGFQAKKGTPLRKSGGLYTIVFEWGHDGEAGGGEVDFGLTDIPF